MPPAVFHEADIHVTRVNFFAGKLDLLHVAIKNLNFRVSVTYLDFQSVFDKAKLVFLYGRFHILVCFLTLVDYRTKVNKFHNMFSFFALNVVITLSTTNIKLHVLVLIRVLIFNSV